MVLDDVTRISMKGYIDSAEEAGKILDNVMKYTMRELGMKWDGERGNSTFLSTINKFYELKKDEQISENELLGLMLLADSAMEKSMKRLPWVRLFSAVTLDTLFSVYSRRSTQGINYDKNLAKVKRMIKKCAGFDVERTTTVDTVLKKVRSARKHMWLPNEDSNEYASKIRDCYSIVKMVLYDGPVDIYDIRTLYKNAILEADSDIDRYEIA